MTEPLLSTQMFQARSPALPVKLEKFITRLNWTFSCSNTGPGWIWSFLVWSGLDLRVLSGWLELFAGMNMKNERLATGRAFLACFPWFPQSNDRPNTSFSWQGSWYIMRPDNPPTRYWHLPKLRHLMTSCGCRLAQNVLPGTHQALANPTGEMQLQAWLIAYATGISSPMKWGRSALGRKEVWRGRTKKCHVGSILLPSDSLEKSRNAANLSLFPTI